MRDQAIHRMAEHDETNDEFAVRLAEMAADTFRAMCYHAFYVRRDAEPRLRAKALNSLAYPWGMSRSTVSKMADVAEVFTEDDFVPGAPLRIYVAAVEITRELWENENPGDPQPAENLRLGALYWLRLATDNDYRTAAPGYQDEPGKIWSTRRMKEEAGILQGKDESPVTFSGTAVVEAWKPSTGLVAFKGVDISGEPPIRAKVTVTPLLERER